MISGADERSGVRSRDYQIFLDGQITTFSYPQCSAIIIKKLQKNSDIINSLLNNNKKNVPYFSCPFVGFLISYFCRFPLFSLLFHGSEARNCLCQSSGRFLRSSGLLVKEMAKSQNKTERRVNRMVKKKEDKPSRQFCRTIRNYNN